jgi:DNA repair protein RadA
MTQVLELMTEDQEITETKKEEISEEITINDIPGVGPSTAEKLIESGYDTIISIAVSTVGEMVEAVGVSESAARKMINFCRNSANMGFESGEEVLMRREKVLKIKTGSEALNQLLDGGVETGAITECFGEYGSGKTQIGHVLCIELQKQMPGAYAIYIDTEKTFRPERIIQLAKGAGLDPDDVLKHIKVAKAYNSDHQMLLAEKVEELISKDQLPVKLVIVDSLTSQFRSEFVGRGTLAARQQKINKHMGTLSKLADVYNLCVYVTNQVMSKPDQFFGDPTAAIGGHIVAHNSTFRIYLRKGKKGTRVAKLVDSPNLPDGEVIFSVETEGLKDV